MKDLFENPTKGTILSWNGGYRYRLWRIWDESKPAMLWVMLNPSTADADQDDPTIRRCIGFARNWGYGGIYVGNLFPYRATKPKALNGKSIHELVGDGNYNHIREMAAKTQLHVLGYGAFKIAGFTPDHYQLAYCQIELITDWQCLGKTKDGHPLHPLFVPYKAELIPFKS